jgi:ABC-type nickel/cobalt efflux system permease component RcnA
MSRLTRPLVVVAAAVLAGLLIPAAPAEAHPMGNFSINQYAGLTLHPDRIDVLALVDIAEIPTLQEKPLVDTDGNGTLSEAELARRATAECRGFAGEFAVTVGNDRLTWTITDPSYRVTPGAGGLSTSRLACSLTADAKLGSEPTVRVDNRYRSGRVGWRELTARAEGIRITTSLPADSVSARLTSYPRDLLTSAPDVRTATIRVGGPGGAAPAATTTVPAIAGPSWLTAAQTRVERVVGGHLTPVVVILAFLLALLLGAGHAALPGHGKTVMAAYFAGRSGRIRDALAVGGTVTLAHTGGVLAVGLLLSTSTALAGEQLLAWLGVASGVLVAAVGIGMLVSARRSRRRRLSLHHDRGRVPADHSHEHEHGHGHGHSHGHSHGHRPGGRLGLAGIGLAGGLVPSPSALVVLLGAIGLGRAGLGVLLVLAYGIGMAGTLTAVGLLLVVAQRKLGALAARSGGIGRLGGLLTRLTTRVSAGAPTATAALVVLVGLGMGVRAVV